MAKKKSYGLDDLSKWRAEQLAKYGGFSHRYIASVVFMKPLHRVTDAEIAQVTGYLHRQKVLLSTWRRGESLTAQQHAASVTKKKRSPKRA